MFTPRKPVGLGALALSAVALGATLGLSAPASATELTSIATTSIPTYATQAVSASGGAITVPASADIAVTLASLTTTAVVNFTLTFTLPSGVLFGSNPALTISPVACAGSASLTGGGTGGQTASFTVTVPVIASATTCTYTLGTFNVTGATSLETATTSTSGTVNTKAVSGTGFTISEAIPVGEFVGHSNLNAGVAQGPVATGIASSASALTAWLHPGSWFGVDTSAHAMLNGQSDPGKVWFGPANDDDSGCGATAWQAATYCSLGSFGYIETQNPSLVTDSSGVNTFTFGSGASGTLTLTGDFAGVSAIYLDGATTPRNCASSASGEAKETTPAPIAGTISGNTANFTLGIAATPTTVSISNICEYTGGATFLGTNPSGLAGSLTVTAGSGATAGASGSYIVYGATARNDYAPGTPYYLTYSVSSGGYQSFLRVVNNSARPIDVFANVQADNGSVGAAWVENGLAPFTNALVPVSTIISNAGVTTTSGRASMILFTSPSNDDIENAGETGMGKGAVGISQWMLNPDGTVVQAGSDNSP